MTETMHSIQAADMIQRQIVGPPQTAVWTGIEMIVWGGWDVNNTFFNTGGRYNPSTDSWVATNTNNAPLGRFVHTAVWTGIEMIVWGGFDGFVSLSTGGRYDPS